jgi:valyl-tRNA synthetase
MAMLPKKYNFAETETKWQQHWQKNNIFAWNEDEQRENNYVIDTPPPTVSGSLHMGHVFSYCQADFIARYKRMRGYNVFYPIGFDDNGLPSERLVEKRKKTTAKKHSREEFVNLCREVVESEEEKFRDLFKNLALSVDWRMEYQTISDNSCKLSQMSFLDLYNKGEIYRTIQPMLWDPVDQTALSQADIEDVEFDSYMNYLSFKLEDGEAKLPVATTRPELLPGCVAVFVHPEDERYKHFIDRRAQVPLFGSYIKILADESVDTEKGTGAVMCCSFGDLADIKWWRLYNLETKIIINPVGKITDDNSDQLGLSETGHSHFQQLVGLKVKDARERVISMLEENEILEEKQSITHMVKCAERSKAPLEILITSQWFVKVLEHKQALKQQVRRINWHPSFMKARIDDWIDNLAWDWCISRQRYFGVPFPVWYSKRTGEEGKVIVPSQEELPVNPLVTAPKGYSLEEVEPDGDVMDTWATSAVSPQLNSGAINEDYGGSKDRHNKLYPADLRPQAHEIIRTWAFYTIAKSYLHTGCLPWKDIMISGWCLAENKVKMSKSKGNVISPENLLNQYGSDVVRYWASNSKLGADTAFSEEIMKLGKKLQTKLWNASKFASMHFDKLPDTVPSLKICLENRQIFAETDLWQVKKLGLLINRVTEQFEAFEYSNARSLVEEFFWRDFCDNYLEIVKARSYNETGEDPAGAISAILTLYHSLQTILKLFAPVIPHITEEIYSLIFMDNSNTGNLQARNSWPHSPENAGSEQTEYSGDLLIKVLEATRKLKAEKNLSVKAPIKKLELPEEFSGYLSSYIKSDLANVVNASSITCAGKFSPELDIVKIDSPAAGGKDHLRENQSSIAILLE